MSQTCRSNSKHLFSSLVAHKGTYRRRVTQLCSRAHPVSYQVKVNAHWVTAGTNVQLLHSPLSHHSPPAHRGDSPLLCSLTSSYWEPQHLTHHISSFCSPHLGRGAKARLHQLLHALLGHSCHMSSLLQSLPPSLASLGNFLCLSRAALSLPDRKHKLLIHPSSRKLSGWKAL